MNAAAVASQNERIGSPVPMPVTESLRAIVGTSNVRIADTAGTVDQDAAIIVLPASTDEVAAVVRVCRQHEISVVPLGGGTGLVGGSIRILARSSFRGHA